MRTRPCLQFFRNEKGIAAIEAALILPVFIMFLIGAVEIYQFFRAQSIVERAAYEIAQSLSLQTDMHKGSDCSKVTNVCTYAAVAEKLMHPLDFTKHGRLGITVRTSTQRTPESPVLWEVEQGWPVTFGRADVYGEPAAYFPLQAVRPRETALSVELAYDTSHLILTGRMRKILTGSHVIVGRAFLRTRNDALRALAQAQP